MRIAEPLMVPTSDPFDADPQAVVDAVLSGLPGTSLHEVNRSARLQTRKDRKYVLDAKVLAELLEHLPEGARVLEIAGRRWFGYESVYYDTEGLDSYRLAACRRPSRFKVRTRTYVDSGTSFAEVKRRDGRGRSVKERIEITSSTDVADAVRRFANTFDAVQPYSADLAPVVASSYERATIVVPAEQMRMTIDTGYECVGVDGKSADVDQVIVETKTAGTPSSVDRLLWKVGCRPVKLSKYATGMAAMHPELPANRWAPVLRAHFGRGCPSDGPARLEGEAQ